MGNNIGKNIKKRLIDMDKKAKDLAEYAGVSEAYISKLCKGERELNKVTMGVAIKMADFLQCSVYELISPPEDEIVNGSARYGLI